MPSGNGLIDVAYLAFSDHHEVWLSVLELRPIVIAHAVVEPVADFVLSFLSILPSISQLLLPSLINHTWKSSDVEWRNRNLTA